MSAVKRTLPICGCNVVRSRQKDSEKPQWQLQVNPWTRYEQFSKQLEEKYKGALDEAMLGSTWRSKPLSCRRAGARVLENMHPTVRRALAIRLGAAALCSVGHCWSVTT